MGITQQIGASSLIKPGVIDNTAARPASPYEGQVIFQKDTDQLLVWNGTAWVIPNSPAQNPQGLELISSTAFSGATTTISNCFSSQYSNYRILISTTASSASGGNIIYLQMPTGAGSYGGSFVRSYGSTVNALASDSSSFTIGYVTTANHQYSFAGDIFYPNLPQPTLLQFQAFGYNSIDNVNYAGSANCFTTTAYTSIIVGVASGTITGTIRIYGYRNS